MPIARVTRRGQVTIPAEVRKVLGIDQGDSLLFEMNSEHSMQLRVVKRRQLADLYRALPATRAFAGKQRARKAVGRELGKAGYGV